MNLTPPDFSHWVTDAQRAAEAATPVHTPVFRMQEEERARTYRRKRKGKS